MGRRRVRARPPHRLGGGGGVELRFWRPEEEEKGDGLVRVGCGRGRAYPLPGLCTRLERKSVQYGGCKCKSEITQISNAPNGPDKPGTRTMGWDRRVPIT